MTKTLPRTGSPPYPTLVLLFLTGAFLFFALTITSMQRTSATFDEPVYIVGGLSFITLHDYTMKDDAPPLVPYLAGFGARTSGLLIPGGQLPFADSYDNEYQYAAAVLYAPGTSADRIVRGARLAVLIPFGLLLLATVMLWSYELWGLAGAAISLLLTSLCPNLIAHGGIVSGDFPCAAAILFASFMLWRAVRTPSAFRFAAAGLALGLALVTKYTALLLIPSAAVLIAVEARRLAGLSPSWISLFARRLLLVLVPAALVVGLIYGLPPRPDLYIRNYQNLYRNVKGIEYSWYLFGQFHQTRIPYYYAAVLAVKTSIPLLALGLGSFVWMRRRNAGWTGELALLLPAFLLLLISTQDVISAGIRRVLPVLPVLAVSAGRWAPVVSNAGWKRLALAIPVAWLVVSSIGAWPHYIPYFNEAVGGSKNGARLLDDSNLDWGQDLVELPESMRRLGMQSVRLFYHGSADPKWYGISVEPATLQQLARHEPGNYAISQHLVIRMRTVGITWPSLEKPGGRAGTSILLYKVGG